MPVRSMPILSRLVLVLPPALPIALCGLLLVASPAAAAQGAEDEAPSAEEIEKAGALFARSCVACHLPPAPKHATDLAWITQLTDTA